MNKVKEVGEGFPGRRYSTCRGADGGDRQGVMQSRSCGSDWKAGCKTGAVREGQRASQVGKSLACHEQGLGPILGF